MPADYSIVNLAYLLNAKVGITRKGSNSLAKGFIIKMPDGLLPEGFFLGTEDYLCVAQPLKNGNCLGVVELCRCGEDKGIVTYHLFGDKFFDMVALWMHVCCAILPIEEFYFLGSFLTCTLK